MGLLSQHIGLIAAVLFNHRRPGKRSDDEQRMTAAKRISMGAALVAVLSELADVFTFKEHEEQDLESVPLG